MGSLSRGSSSRDGGSMELYPQLLLGGQRVHVQCKTPRGKASGEGAPSLQRAAPPRPTWLCSGHGRCTGVGEGRHMSHLSLLKRWSLYSRQYFSVCCPYHLKPRKRSAAVGETERSLPLCLGRDTLLLTGAQKLRGVFLRTILQAES